MANSYVEYSTGLSGTTFSIPFNYISVDDVLVKGYNGSSWSDLTVSSRDASNDTVTLDSAPSAYTKIRVLRSTSSAQLVDFQDGSRLSASDLDTAYQQGLFVAQEVSENASTNIEGIGPQGPQGIQGVAGNDGADGADGVSSTVALSQSFESAEIAIPSSDGFVTATHGLGSIPKLYSVCLRCKTAEHGYAIGDEVNLSSVNAYRTSTEVSFLATASVTLYHKTTGAYGSTITNSNWKIVFRAFA